MTKSRKKKNYKLRRRVKRTIAALIMIMAVVVAAIPVENLDRAQAASDIETMYNDTIKKNKDLIVIDMPEYVEDGKGEEAIMQTMKEGRLSNQFVCKLQGKASGTVGVVKGFDTSGLNTSTNINVEDKMYYGYLAFSTDFVENTFKDAIKNDEYGGKCSVDVTTKTVTYNGSDPLPPGVDDTVPLPGHFLTDSFSYLSNITTSGTISDNNTSYTYKANKFSCDEVFTNENAYFKNQYDEYINKLQIYNSRYDILKDYGDTVCNETPAQWEQYIKDIEALKKDYNTLKDSPLNIKVGDLDFSDNMRFFYDSFCNRIDYDSNFSLVGFTLDRVYDENQSAEVYAVKWAGATDDPAKEIAAIDHNTTRANRVDSKGYVTGGFAFIIGIADEAFMDKQITSITLSGNIQFIGDDAFARSSLKTIKFNPKSCTKIGNRAFKSCQISEINLTNDAAVGEDANISSLKEIGTEAFYGTNISELVFPANLEKLGAGCFAQTVSLENIDFSRIDQGGSNKFIISPFAFYNCTNLGSTSTAGGIVFPSKDSMKMIIGTGAFAVSDTSGDNSTNMQDFEFPKMMKKINYSAAEVGYEVADDAELNDYVLYGRTQLKNVIFPRDLSDTIPDNTLRKCRNLESVVLGAMSKNDTAGRNITYKTDSTLYADIENPYFYVAGPGYKDVASADKSTPRVSTVKLRTGYINPEDNNSGFVPYKFIDSDGKTKMEISAGKSTDTSDPTKEGPFLAVIDEMNDVEFTAQISGYSWKDGVQKEDTELFVPAYIGMYRIVGLGSKCFDDILANITSLKIEDGSISSIAPQALNGADKLTEVKLADTISSIGEDAFAGCTSLENVYFSEPAGINDDSWGSVMSIDDGAFKTNSPSLVFHGAIHDGYAPFEYAMSAENAGFTNRTDGKNICYQSDSPESLSVIRDNATGLSTLVDYPHMENVDAAVLEAFKKHITNGDELSNEQASIINGTLHIVIPDGIDSIDVKNYFGSGKNDQNKGYIDKTINSGDKVIDKYLIDDEANNVTAGLFSGWFNENTIGGLINVTRSLVGTSDSDSLSLDADVITPRESSLNLKNGLYEENEIKGNDHLTSIALGDDVEGMPEKYAFDSCENLERVTLGAKVSDLGIMPFKGCKSLVDVSSNAFYKCENGILYKVGDDGTFNTITECLESRGDSNGPLNNSVIDVKGDPAFANVTTISEEAFSDCLNLSEIDFTGTGVTGIPKDCFKGDKNLRSIILPETISFVEEGAFADLSNGASDLTKVVLKIYEPNCYINSNAIDNTTKYLVYGYEFADSKNTKKSAVYNFCQAHSNVEFKALEPGYTVTFRNYNGKMIDEVTGITDSSQRIVPPDMEEYLKTNPYDGHIFSDWLWTDSTGTDHYGADAYSNINEDRDVYATYKLDPGDYVFTGEDVNIEIVNGTLNGNGTMNDKKTTITIASGKDIYITADKLKDKTFSYWSVSDGLDQWINNIHDKQTTFTVPNPPESGKITITANFLNTPGSGSSGGGGTGGGGTGDGDGTGGGSGSGGTGGGGSTTDSTTKYKVTVNYGTGSGEYKAGDTVNISALAPDTSSKVFSKWTSATSGVGFANATSATTSFIMPASDVTVTANYKTRTSDDDDDDSDRGSSSSGRPGSGSTTNTVTNRPSSSTSTTGTTGTVTNTTNGNTTGNNNSNNNNGNKLYITKNGVSNKDVGSVSVDGSTDNFIVKISDSDEATAAVKEALTNKYGSLDGLAYFPMDISLYDSTGQNKITDTYGLNITVTMPIPDVLIQYGGNARVAAADNGNLQQLTPKFTTIDGIACISFVPPHFSPYVIYVDTNNLVAGQTLDSTPSTGDPIHPKWFAAIGMACISIILFATSDGHKRRKYRAA